MEGCFLLPSYEACARLGIERPAYESARNGSGPLAWNHHWLLIPLHDRVGELVGVIWADEPEDRLIPSTDRLQALRMFANQAATAVAVAAAFEEMQFLAENDPLTRVGNRRAFTRRLAEEVHRAGRYGQRFALVVLDVDGFKALNDRYGHFVGDLALEAIGDVLRATLRRSDSAFRLGGDEFALILEDAGVQEATAGRRPHRRRHRRRPGRRRPPAARILRRRHRRRGARSRGAPAGRRRGHVRGQARRRRRALRGGHGRLDRRVGSAVRVDLTLSPSEESFRDELRTWLDANHPGREPEGDDAGFAFRRGWQRKLHDAGWAGVSWPTEYGGRGATLVEQAIYNEEFVRAQAPSAANVLGLAMGGPTVIAHGTEEQRRRYLEPILSAEEIWCQGFSEPGSGSDLASVKTKAVRDGDD